MSLWSIMKSANDLAHTEETFPCHECGTPVCVECGHPEHKHVHGYGCGEREIKFNETETAIIGTEMCKCNRHQ